MKNFKRIALAGAASVALMAAPAYAGVLGGSVGVGIGANASSNANASGVVSSAMEQGDAMKTKAEETADAAKKKGQETADTARQTGSSVAGEATSNADANLSAKGAASVN